MAATSNKKSKRSLDDLDLMDKSYELINALKCFRNSLKNVESVPNGVLSHDEIYAILILKFGYKCVQCLDEAIRSVPPVFSTHRIHYIHERYLELSSDGSLTLAELQLCVNMMHPFCFADETENENKRKYLSGLFFAPPVDVCCKCKKNLTLHNKPSEITFYGFSGIQHGVKLCLQCKKCRLNYNYSTYGNKSEGNKFYEESRLAIEASDSTFMDRRLFEFYCSLAYVY